MNGNAENSSHVCIYVYVCKKREKQTEEIAEGREKEREMR